MNIALVTLLLAFSDFSSAISDLKISDDDYNLLPPIFHIDPYEECLQEDKQFCKVEINLFPANSKNPSKAWKIIQATKASKSHYNHDELFHALCATNYAENPSSDFSTAISDFYTAKYKSIGLIARVSKIDCKNHNEIYKTGIFDISLLIFIFVYAAITAIATFCDFARGKNASVSKYFIIFSVRHNLQKLRDSYYKVETQKLKCIQGMRFYTTLLIIFCHTFCSFAGGFISNTQYLEDLPQNPLRHGVRNLFLFLVQTFFLISGWLLSFNTFQVFQSKTDVNLIKYVWLTFINRFLRIIPPVALMVLLGTSVWIYGSFYGPIKDIFSDMEYLACQKNWWKTILFINNHSSQNAMCYFITWYLSADTQLYALSLILLALIWKFRNRTKTILGVSLLIGVAIPGVISYIYDLDIIHRLVPENSKYYVFYSFEFNASYCATYTNMATFMLGIIFGYIYYQYGQKEISVFKFQIYRILWWICFIGPPVTSVVASSFVYNRLNSAILSAILRPLYGVGMGVGILGMSQNLGGIIKRFFEWKPAVFMGNITYSTYVVHFSFVFYRTALATKPLYVSDLILLKSLIQDILISFTCGFLMHVLVEMPAGQLQNLLVPKIRTGFKKCDRRKTQKIY